MSDQDVKRYRYAPPFMIPTMHTDDDEPAPVGHFVTLADYDTMKSRLEGRCVELEGELKLFQQALDPGAIQMREYTSHISDIAFAFKDAFDEQAGEIERLRELLWEAGQYPVIKQTEWWAKARAAHTEAQP